MWDGIEEQGECIKRESHMLDALVAAATVKEFVNGRGTEIGGGDGLGTIIIPRPLSDPVIKEVLEWPSFDSKSKK